MPSHNHKHVSYHENVTVNLVTKRRERISDKFATYDTHGGDSCDFPTELDVAV